MVLTKDCRMVGAKMARQFHIQDYTLLFAVRVNTRRTNWSLLTICLGGLGSVAKPILNRYKGTNFKVFT